MILFFNSYMTQGQTKDKSKQKKTQKIEKQKIPTSSEQDNEVTGAAAFNYICIVCMVSISFYKFVFHLS